MALARLRMEARLVKDVFLEVLRHRPSIKTMADLARLSPMLTFADAPVVPAALPTGFEPLATALFESRALTISYALVGRGAEVRKITPRLLLQANGLAYVIAHCHRDGFEKTFRLDRILRCWLD
jgi:predicted DNA-binding transcriptional regulator YafY